MKKTRLLNNSFIWWQVVGDFNTKYYIRKLRDFHINILSVCLSEEYVDEHNRTKKLGQTVGSNGGNTFHVPSNRTECCYHKRTCLQMKVLSFIFSSGKLLIDDASYSRMYHICLLSKIYIILCLPDKIDSTFQSLESNIIISSRLDWRVSR